MADLAAHWSYLEEAWHASCRAPLSVRKAMLTVALVDAFVDRLFERSDVSDIVVFRGEIAQAHPALGLVISIASHRADGPKLALANIEVPIEHYGELAVEDFMVSLYNNHSVQQLVVQSRGASDTPALALMGSAVTDLRALWMVELRELR